MTSHKPLESKDSAGLYQNHNMEIGALKRQNTQV